MDITSVPSLMSFQFISWKYNIKKQNCDKSVCVSLFSLNTDVSRIVARSLLCHWGRNTVRLGFSLADWLWSWGNDKVKYPVIKIPCIAFYLRVSFQTALPSISSQLYWYEDGNMSDGEHWSVLSGKEVITSHHLPRYHSQPAKLAGWSKTNLSLHPPHLPTHIRYIWC